MSDTEAPKQAIIVACGKESLPMRLNDDGLLVWHRWATVFPSAKEARDVRKASMDLARKQGIDQRWLQMKVIKIDNND